MTPQAPLPDAPPEELFARFRERGDVAALGALFDATSPTLFRMALALAPDPASAEDAVQETFLTLMAPGSHYDPSRPLLPWMVGILQLKVHEARRRVRRTVDPARLAPPVFPDDPLSAAESGEEVERIRAALDALPEPYRAVAILRWRYGLEPAAIADARNEPPGTVRSLLHRAQEKLRSSLRMLPAFLLVGRAPRGMDAVRSTVMAKGAAVAAAVGVSAVSVAVAGGMLMAPKTLVAVAAVLVLGGTAWFTLGPGGMRTRSVAVPPVVAAKPRLPRPLPPESLPIPDPPAVPIPADLPPPVDLSKCDRDLDLFGTTVDEGGRPVAGARIETHTNPWRRTSMAPRDQAYEEETGASTRSSVDGTFRLRLTRGEMVDLRATADGYGMGGRSRCLAGERVTLVLRIGGGGLIVTAVDEERKPVKGALVWFSLVSPGSYHGSRELELSVSTDERGLCEFLHLSPGPYGFYVQHAFLENREAFRGEIPASGSASVEVILRRGRLVTGRVTDASTGSPIPGALVVPDYSRVRATTSDAAGRFEISGMTSEYGMYLEAAAKGYGTIGCRVDSSATVDFALDPAYSVVGRVVDGDGTPVPGARVLAGGTGTLPGRYVHERASDLTDADGRFRLADLSPRCPKHDLVVEAKGRGLVAFDFHGPVSGETVLDLGEIRTPFARAIEGLAVDPEGKPVAGMDVSVYQLKKAGEPKPADPRDNGVMGTGYSSRTDDLGRFRFPGLCAGRWQISLRIRGAPFIERTIELTEAEDVLDVVLPQSGKSLGFLVTDGEGRPIPGIAISTDMSFPSGSGTGSVALNALTGTDGRARFTALPESPSRGAKGVVFNVQPYSGDTAPPWSGFRTESIVPDGQEVHIVLEPAGLVRGRVLGPGDEPVAELYVEAFDESGKRLAYGLASCNARGEFELRAPAGTAITLKVSGDRTVPAGTAGAFTRGPTPWRAELAGVKVPAKDVVLRAKKVSIEGGLDIVILDLAGKPVPGMAMHAWRSGDGRSGTTDGAGRIYWEGMLEEEWNVVATPVVPDGAPEDAVPPASVDVVPKGQEVLMRFRRGVAVDGTVLLPDGTPAAAAILGFNLYPGGGGPARQRKTDDRGRFRLWFGDEAEFRIEAVLIDAKGVVLRGESEQRRAADGDVTIRLAPE